MSEVLDIVFALARAQTVGSFIDRGMEELTNAVSGSLVSFNRVDLNSRMASVALRPYRSEQEPALYEVARLLDEHPLYDWYRNQPDWSPVRISDVVPWREFRRVPVGEQGLMRGRDDPVRSPERWLAPRLAVGFTPGR